MNKYWLLGDPEIDQQHQDLFSTLDHLALLDQAGDADALVNEHLSCLSDQICHHFVTEEAAMQEVGIPESMFLAHKAAHIAVVEELTEFHLGALAGKRLSLEEIVAKVLRWVQIHLVEYDLQLALYFKQRPRWRLFPHMKASPVTQRADQTAGLIAE